MISINVSGNKKGAWSCEEGCAVGPEWGRLDSRLRGNDGDGGVPGSGEVLGARATWGTAGERE